MLLLLSSTFLLLSSLNEKVSGSRNTTDQIHWASKHPPQQCSNPWRRCDSPRPWCCRLWGISSCDQSITLLRTAGELFRTVPRTKQSPEDEKGNMTTCPAQRSKRWCYITSILVMSRPRMSICGIRSRRAMPRIRWRHQIGNCSKQRT